VKSEHNITILFDPPFWVALFEKIENDKYSVAKAIIGASEPTEVEIANFLNNLDLDELQYTMPIATAKAHKEKISFKKRQKLTREATSESKVKHVYSKSQALLKEQFEANKIEQKTLSKLQKEEIEQRKFDLKQIKKKEKHKGH
jgi:hypothetical protein